jgi:hypothetical protein
MAELINNPYPGEDEQMLRDFLLPRAPASHVFSANSISRHLKNHLDGPVNSGGRTLVLRSHKDKHLKTDVFHVAIILAT